MRQEALQSSEIIGCEESKKKDVARENIFHNKREIKTVLTRERFSALVQYVNYFRILVLGHVFSGMTLGSKPNRIRYRNLRKHLPQNEKN